MEGHDAISFLKGYQEGKKAGRKEAFEYLNGWCEHTTNPMQRRYLCKACRQALKSELGE